MLQRESVRMTDNVGKGEGSLQWVFRWRVCMRLRIDFEGEEGVVKVYR